jgi:hypothetical protein
MPDLAPIEQDILNFIDKVSGSPDFWIKGFMYLIIVMVAITFLRHAYNKHKLKPEEKRKGADIHADIVGILEKIYLAYYKKGIKLEKKYPKIDDIHVLEHNKRFIYAWLITPKNPHHVKAGDVGNIFINRYSIWSKEGRTKIAALLAAWWFNLYYYASRGESLRPLNNLSKLRRISKDTLTFAGVEYAAEINSPGSIDIVKLLTKDQKIEHEHRRIARIEQEDIEAIKALRAKEEFAYGKMSDVHKVGRSWIRHGKDLIHLAKRQLRLLEEDLRIRKQLGEAHANSEYAALMNAVLRMEVIVPWLETNVNVNREDKARQKELDDRLNEFERLILDVSERLKHLDTILEQGSRLKPVHESAFA